jgi:hypothetical protein
VQSNILSRTADSGLRAFVIWVPFLGGTRTAINPSIFPGSRVTSFWDGTAMSSQWFSQHVTNQPGPTCRALSSARAAPLSAEPGSC